MIQMRYIVIPILIFFWALWTKKAYKEFRKENPEATVVEILWCIIHGIALLVALVIGGSWLVDFIIAHW
jgi:hypothetical protein